MSNNWHYGTYNGPLECDFDDNFDNVDWYLIFVNPEVSNGEDAA